MAYVSKEKQREYNRRHYLKYKLKYLDRNNKRKAELLVLFRGLKDRPCYDCGIKYPYYVMDFDHREGVIKKYQPFQLVSRGGKRALLTEIAKCDLVCSNCHRIRTYERARQKRDMVDEAAV